MQSINHLLKAIFTTQTAELLMSIPVKVFCIALWTNNQYRSSVPGLHADSTMNQFQMLNDRANQTPR
jgi:hypothetical protein